MVLSLDPETICRLSEEKATLRTSLVWPTKRRVVVPLREEGSKGRSQTNSKEKSGKATPKLEIFGGKKKKHGAVYERAGSTGSRSPPKELRRRAGGMGMSLARAHAGLRKSQPSWLDQFSPE